MLYMYTLDRITDVAQVGGGVYPQRGLGFLICHKRDDCVCGEGRLVLAAGLTFRYLFNSVFSSSVNNLECIINRTPSGISREKLEPLPAVISTVKWVCFQYSNWSWFI